MTTTLITGANKGLGRETARRLVAAGHDVWIGARDPEAGRAAADALGARFVALDVTDQASVDAAAATVAGAGGLDVLVNNAGIAGAMATTLETDVDVMARLYDTNVLGVVRVTRAFRALLDASPAPVVVNVSSSLGSLGWSSDPAHSDEFGYPGIDYPATKSALNMLTVKLAQAMPAARVNAVTPGYCATDLNGFSGPRSIEQGAEAIVQAATLGPDGATGTFFDDEGPVAW